MTKKKFTVAETVDAIKQKALDEAAKGWRPTPMVMSGTEYWRLHGKAPYGCKVYIGCKVYDDRGRDVTPINPPKPPVKGFS